MKSSPYAVFSLYKRVEFIFYDHNYDMYHTLKNPVGFHWFKQTNRYTKENCVRIFNEIESGQYALNHVAIIMAHNSIWHSSANLGQVRSENVQKIMGLYTKIQLKKDRNMLVAINEEANLDGIEEYFRVRENGKPIIYDLIINNSISPYFYMHYRERILTPEFEHSFLFDKEKTYVTFQKKLNILKDLIFNKTLNHH
jgi:hypothetical protein